ncbi:MAG: hypothetical protein WC251_05655 [Candidatus Izemoplasmatales bacterium]
MSKKLTPEQLEQWRAVLQIIVGVGAAVMTSDDIQKFHDQVQANINKTEKEQE